MAKWITFKHAMTPDSLPASTRFFSMAPANHRFCHMKQMTNCPPLPKGEQGGAKHPEAHYGGIDKKNGTGRYCRSFEQWATAAILIRSARTRAGTGVMCYSIFIVSDLTNNIL